MSLLVVVLVLALVGMLVWAVTRYLPVDPTFKRIIVVVAVIASVIWLLKVFGVLGYIGKVSV